MNHHNVFFFSWNPYRIAKKSVFVYSYRTRTWNIHLRYEFFVKHLNKNLLFSAKKIKTKSPLMFTKLQRKKKSWRFKNRPTFTVQLLVHCDSNKKTNTNYWSISVVLPVSSPITDTSKCHNNASNWRQIGRYFTSGRLLTLERVRRLLTFLKEPEEIGGYPPVCFCEGYAMGTEGFGA